MWSMPRNLRKLAVLAIALMALAGFVSGLLGARDVAYLPGEAPASGAPAAPTVAAPEVTPLPTDLPPPPTPEAEPEPEPETAKPEEKPKPASEPQPAAPSAKAPAGQDAVGDLIQGADAATTQPPPY